MFTLIFVLIIVLFGITGNMVDLISLSAVYPQLTTNNAGI
jgi:hypothetical protein